VIFFSVFLNVIALEKNLGKISLTISSKVISLGRNKPTAAMVYMVIGIIEKVIH